MDLTKFVQSGYGSLYVESSEVKRAVNSIRVNSDLSKVVWNYVQGIVRDPFNDAKNEEADQLAILEKATHFQKCIVVLENYDLYLNDAVLIQTFLNKYPLFKANQTCLVMVGTDRSKIPPIIKEYVPVLEFNLPTEEEITATATKIGKIAKAAIESSKNVSDEDRKRADFSVTRPIIETCKALTQEELENVLAYSARVHYRFDQPTILTRKRDMLRQTGFMDYAEPEPLENLGGHGRFQAICFKPQRTI